MPLFLPGWALLVWFPRFLLVAVLAVVLAYPAWFLQNAAFYPDVEQPSLYLLSAFAANFALGGVVVVAISKWIRSRGAKQKNAEQDALLNSMRDPS